MATPTSPALPTPPTVGGAPPAAPPPGAPRVGVTTQGRGPECDLVRNHHLLPMLNKGQVHAIQLDTRDRTGNLQGFDGSMTTPADQARAWKARFAPTVLFLGPKGEELAERLVGVAVPDFYGEYLDERLRQARDRLR